MLRRSYAWAGTVCLLSGCGQAHDPGPEGSDAGAEDAGAEDAGAPSEDAGDPNGTIDRATEIHVGDFPGTFDSLDGREDADYFSFEGHLGEWVSIRTTDTVSFSDTPLTLYGTDRQRLAANRYTQSIQGENVLSRIVTRLPSSGRYYVGIVNPAAPSISWGFSQPYRISVVDADTTEGYTVNVEGEAPTEARVAHWSTPGGDISDVFLAGTFDSDDDVDAFSFEVSGDKPELIDAKLDVSGSDGNGSTSSVGTVWVTDPSGKTVIGRIDGTMGQTSLTPPLSAGKYLLWTAHPKTPLGANDFYVIRALIAPDNPLESEDATNGTLESAERLEVTPLDNAGSQLQAFILASLGDADVDYFRFDGKAGQTASVSCISHGDGSGVVGLDVSIRDDHDKPLAEATEDDTTSDGVSLDSIPMPSSGVLYMRLTKARQLPDVAGDWARCVVFAN